MRLTIMSLLGANTSGCKSPLQVSGQYSVLLPDGRILTVKYRVTAATGYVVSSFGDRFTREYFYVIMFSSKS